MQVFHCQCGATLFFENTQCLKCKRALGYLPDRQIMSPLEPSPDADLWTAQSKGAKGQTYRKCGNYAQENVCNWMIPSADQATYCIACRLNKTIPDLSRPENREYWSKIEGAKRRLVYSLLGLGLPVVGKQEDDKNGLAFAFLADAAGGGGGEQTTRVMTGHDNGLITLNIAEADEIEREQVRRQVKEAYRTLLGHFRHESGHYYWDRLVRGTAFEEPCRKLFGDDRADYGEALKRHYESGNLNWQAQYISVYASSHPWEDWAETWAHYLHMFDTLETSSAVGISAGDGADDIIDARLFAMGELGRRPAGPRPGFTKILREWTWLSVALNELNRGMGMHDAYPFVLNEPVARKLQFVHDVIGRSAGPSKRQ
jgi:hypothetical protein